MNIPGIVCRMENSLPYLYCFLPTISTYDEVAFSKVVNSVQKGIKSQKEFASLLGVTSIMVKNWENLVFQKCQLNHES